MNRRSSIELSAGAIAFLVLACSSNVEPSSAVGPSDQSQVGGAANGGSPSACEPFCGNGAGTGLAAGGAATLGSTADGAAGPPICAGVENAVEALPVDLYVMFDQSSSMGDPLPDGSGTWWTAAQRAVK